MLENTLQGVQGSVGVVATDLATGESAAVNPTWTFPAASVAKVPIAMALLHLVTEGRVSLQEKVVYHADTDYEGGAGSLQFELKDGDAVSLDRLLERMIRVSDNIARNMIERYIGSDTIRQYMLDQGVQPPYYAPWPLMTAEGSDTLLRRLDAGKAGISPELTRLLLDHMEHTVFNDRIPAGLPPDVTVAHKVGTLENDVHDVGIVYAPDRSFILSVFTENIPYDDATSLIARLASVMYGYEDWLVSAGG